MLKEFGIKALITAITAVFAYKGGFAGAAMVLLVAVMALDYGSGLIRGVLTQSVNSSTGLRGLLKKMLMIILVGVAALVEVLLHLLSMGTGNMLLVTVICFFFVNECLSVTENAAQLGLPIPKPLVGALNKLKEVGGKEQIVVRGKKEEAEAKENEI